MYDITIFVYKDEYFNRFTSDWRAQYYDVNGIGRTLVCRIR